MDYEDKKEWSLSEEPLEPYRKVPRWKPDKSSSSSLTPKYGQLPTCEVYLPHQLQPYIQGHQKIPLHGFAPQDYKSHQVAPAG